MWFISLISDENAAGLLREIYDEDLHDNGYISNTRRAWSHRPELFSSWQQLVKGIRSHLRLRTYELLMVSSARHWLCFLIAGPRSVAP